MKFFQTQVGLLNAIFGILLEIFYTAAIMLVSLVVCLVLYFKQWS